MKKTIFLFCLFICFFSYSKNFNYRLFSVKDGLSQNKVNCILQDTEGFLWIGTDDGINIYDGYAFMRFKPGKGILNSQLISSMALDSERKLIWIATVDKGLFLYNQKNDNVISVGSNKIPFNIRKILLDKHGNLFIASNSQVLKVIYDEKNKKVTDILSVFKSPQKCLINSLSIDIYNCLWIGANKFLYKISLDNNKIKNIKDSFFVKNLILHDNDLYIVSDRGLFRINKLTDKLIKLNSLNLINVFFNSNGKIFFFNQKGVFLSDENYEIKDKLNSVIVYGNDILEDHTGNIWSCTSKTGICQLMKERYGFRNYLLKTNSEINISIESFFKDSNNSLLIGTDCGVYKKNKYNRYYKVLDGNTIHKIIKIPNDNKLFLAGDYWSYFLTPSIDSSEIKTQKITNFHYNIFDSYISKKYFWFATYNNGLVRVNRDDLNDSKEFHVGCINNSIYKSNPVRKLLLDSSDNLWICTSNGVYILPKNERLKEQYSFTKLRSSNLLNEYFVTIMQSHDNKIWLGSLYHGLFCLTKKDSILGFSCKKYDVECGLSNNCIKSIKEDKNGSIWVSTNKGINKIEYESDKIIKYSISDDFASPEFCENSECSLSSSSFVFGRVNGYTFIDVDSIEDNKIEPKLVVSKIEVNNKLYRKIFSNSNIVLKHNENNINISFAALDYDFPLNNLYKYKLLGLENKWIFCNYQSRNARYTDLSPGNYTFVFNGANQDGLWCAKSYKINIKILKPFWMTWYAYFMFIVLIIVILYCIVKAISINNRRENRIIISHKEKEQIEKMTNIKIDFFTNISHELRTPITLLSLPLQQIISSKEIKTDKGLKNLMKIDRNVNSLLRLTDQLLNFAKNESGNLKADLSNNDIIPFLKSLIYQFEDWAEKKKVTFIMENSFDSYILPFNKQMMEQVFYNLLSNALKYTVENSKVYIKVKRVEKNIIISIKDEGYGMSEEMKSHLFDRFYRGNNKENENVGGTGLGLYLTKSLVELQKGTITCESFLNKGTKFIITMPFGNNVLITSDTKNIEINENASVSKKTMLIVDDNFEILDVLEDVFNDDYKIIKAFNGKQALDITYNIIPDFIISDIMMPLLDGYELCEKIKSNIKTSHIPIILLTAKDDIKDKIKGLNLSADSYCTKPFNIEELKSLVYSILNNRKLLNTKVDNSVNQTTGLNMNPIDKRFLSKITEVINRNISNTDFHVEQLSQEIGMNNNTLCKKVKTLTSQTTAAYIRSIRLNKAAELLMYNSNSIADITFEVGFVDLKYFRTCFKNKFGCAPSEYYKLHKNKNK